MMLFALSIAFLAVIAWEVPGLIRKKMRRELAVFGVILTLAFILALVQIYRLPFPNPTHIITMIYRPLSLLLLGGP